MFDTNAFLNNIFNYSQSETVSLKLSDIYSNVMKEYGVIITAESIAKAKYNNNGKIVKFLLFSVDEPNKSNGFFDSSDGNKLFINNSYGCVVLNYNKLFQLQPEIIDFQCGSESGVAFGEYWLLNPKESNIKYYNEQSKQMAIDISMLKGDIGGSNFDIILQNPIYGILPDETDLDIFSAIELVKNCSAKEYKKN